jgi:hypothetical protein
MKARQWYRRRPFYGALLVALVAAGIPVSQGLASASSKTVTVPVETNNSSCTFNGSQTAIGAATFSRNKDGSVTIRYSLRGADPTRNYYVYLFSDSPGLCTYMGYFGKFKVDASGDGGKTFTVTGLSGYTDFWVEGYNNDGGFYDRSDVAHV